VNNEDLLTLLPGETVMIRCDKPNHNFNKKNAFNLLFAQAMCVGFIGCKLCLLISQAHE
jgi:hypothetical protein